MKKAHKEELTPWETYLQKRREKNRAKREQSTKSTGDEVSHNIEFFSRMKILQTCNQIPPFLINFRSFL